MSSHIFLPKFANGKDTNLHILSEEWWLRRSLWWWWWWVVIAAMVDVLTDTAIEPIAIRHMPTSVAMMARILS